MNYKDFLDDEAINTDTDEDGDFDEDAIMMKLYEFDESFEKSYKGIGDFWNRFFGIAQTIATRPLTPDEIEDTIITYHESRKLFVEIANFLATRMNNLTVQMDKIDAIKKEIKKNVSNLQVDFANKYPNFYDFFGMKNFDSLKEAMLKDIDTVYFASEPYNKVRNFVKKKVERIYDEYLPSLDDWKKQTLTKNRTLRRPIN